MTTTAETSRTPRGSLIVILVLATLWAAWALWFATAPTTNPGGQCEGLGFGCTLTPHDLAAFAGIIFLTPATFLVVALTLVVRATRIGRGSPRTVWDVLLAVLLVAVGVLFVIGNLSGSL